MLPDWLLHILLPVGGGAAFWAFKIYIKDISKSPPDDMSVKDYKKLVEMLVMSLNGRYMLAEEARKRFTDIETKLENILVKLDDKGSSKE